MVDLIDPLQSNSRQAQSGVSLLPDPASQDAGVQYDSKKAEEKAAMAHFALGDKFSPGLPALREKYETGRGSEVDNMAVQRSKAVQTEVNRTLVDDFFNNRPNPGEPLNEEETVSLQSLMDLQPRANPNTALHEQLAEKYYSTAISQAMEDSDEDLATVVDENPQKAGEIMDFHVKDLTTVNLIYDQLEKLQTRDDSTAKVISDFMEKFVPGKETYELFQLDDDLQEESLPDESFLPGKNLKDKFDHFYSLPAEAQAELLPRIVDALAERNTLTAASFLARLVSYPQAEERFENLMGALDLVDITTATGVAAGAFKLGLLMKTSQAILRGAVRRPLGVTKALDSIADVTQSAHIKAKNRIRRKAKNLPETTDIDGVFETVPSLFNPRAVLSGSDESLSALTQSRLLTLFRKNGHRLMGAIDDTATIQRLREGDIDGVLLALRDQVTTEFPNVADKIIDVKPAKRASDTLTGTDVFEVTFGNLNGELFTSKRAAEKTARDFYQLPKGYEIRPKGARWEIAHRTTVDERSPGINKLELSSEEISPQTGSYIRELIRRFETPLDTFSVAGREDRLKATLGGSRLLGLTRGVDEVFRSLPRRGRNDLATFLNKEKNVVNEAGTQGKFRDNLGELQDAWRKEFDRSPTANEVAAYFTYRQLNDMDWVVRNFSALSAKSRRNIKNVTTSLPNQEQFTFEGSLVGKEALRSDETAGVLVVRGNGQHSYIRTSTPEARAEINKMIDKNGYRMVQASPKGQDAIQNNSRFRKTVGSGNVNFVLTKSPKASRLNSKQIDYEPGGHIVYQEGNFTVQPKIHHERDPNTGTLVANNYQGDNALFWWRTAAEAKKYTPRINEARQILKSGIGRGKNLTGPASRRLKEHLAEHLPFWSVSDFKRLFREFKEDAAFSVNDDFVPTEWGKNSSQTNNLKEKYPMFRDETNSSYNLYSEMNQTFLGDRNAPLLTVKERGSQGSPMMRLDRAPTLDAFPSLERGLNSLLENKFLDNLKFNAATRFIKEFGDVLDTRATRERMLRNPLPYLFSSSFRRDADPAKVRAAQNHLRATKELLNVDNHTNRILRRMKSNLADSIYGVSGQRGVGFAEGALSKIKDPTAFLRAGAFHMTLGMFNPVQLFVQGTTFVHIMALGGARNAAAAAPAAWMMQFAKHTLEPKVLDSLADKATSFGWRKDHWLEANEALQRSGFNTLGREQAMLDNAFDPQFLSTRSGRALDGAAVFFNFIETALRHGAYAASYRRWRVNNPKKKFNEAAETEVLKDAQKFSVDMTADANAMWQKGWASIPTQFWSYSTRMTEQFLSKRLTNRERARIIGFYSAAFGIPAAAAIPTNFPFTEFVRDKLNEEGIDVDDTVFETFRDGILSTALEAIGGTDFDVSGRLSPEGLGVGQSIWDLTTGDKTTMELLIGIGGGRLGETVRAAFAPFHRHMLSLGEPDSESAPWVSPEEARQVLNKISSIKQIERAFFAINYEAYYTSQGRLTALSTPDEGVFSAITGLTPDYIAQVYSLKRVTQDQRDFKNKVRREIQKEYSALLRALQREDLSTAMEAERTMGAWFQGGGFTPEERADTYTALQNQNRELLDSLDSEYVDGVIEKRMERATMMQKMKEERLREMGVVGEE